MLCGVVSESLQLLSFICWLKFYDFNFPQQLWSTKQQKAKMKQGAVFRRRPVCDESRFVQGGLCCLPLSHQVDISISRWAQPYCSAWVCRLPFLVQKGLMASTEPDWEESEKACFRVAPRHGSRCLWQRLVVRLEVQRRLDGTKGQACCPEQLLLALHPVWWVTFGSCSGVFFRYRWKRNTFIV